MAQFFRISAKKRYLRLAMLLPPKAASMLLLVELALRFMGIGQSRINQPVAIALKSGLSIPENLPVGSMDSCGVF